MHLTQSQRHALLSSGNSRRNKFALVAEYHRQGNYLEYSWAGVPYNSRLSFQFITGGEWYTAKSYDEDIRPLLKDK